MGRPVAGGLRIRSVRRLSGTKLEPGGFVRTRGLEARHGRAGVAAARRASVVGVGNAGAEGVVGRVPSLLGEPWVHARRWLESVLKCRRGLRPVGRIRDDALLRVVRDRRLGRRRRVPVSRGRNPGCSEGGSRLRRPNSARVVREERSVRTSVFLTRGGRTWAGRIGTGARFNNRSARVTDARGSRARTAMLVTAAYFPNFSLPFGRTPGGTMGTRVGQSKRGWCGRGSSENQPCFLSRGLNFGRRTRGL